MTGDDELAAVLRQARDRFVAGFPDRCREIESALSLATRGRPVPDMVRQTIHRLAGLAGTVGFSEISRLAAGAEALIVDGRADPTSLGEALMSMREAFRREVSRPAGVVEEPAAAASPRIGAAVSGAPGTGQRILVVDDDAEQRQLTTRALEAGGYDVVALPLADTVIETTEQVKPALVLLDVMMPGITGHIACRLLKAEPSTRDVPIMFLSSNSTLDERMAGMALGAVDYVAKPFDPADLLFRVRRVIAAKPEPVAAPAADLLDYAEFERRARQALAGNECTLVLLRVDAASRESLATELLQETRRVDLVAQFDRLHVIMLLPELSTSASVSRIEPLLARLTERGAQVRAGLAAAMAGGALEPLVREADEALAAARFHGTLVGWKGQAPPQAATSAAASQLVLVADDDPEVIRIVDAQIRSLRFSTALAFDGQAALAVLAQRQVDLLILDLMLPKVTGFEILHHLKVREGKRPRLIVLSARGREEDITRAFELGADDYVTKPFRPQELAARVVRLLR